MQELLSIPTGDYTRLPLLITLVKLRPSVWFQVHFILNELVMGGMVLETNMTEILTRIEEQNKIEKEEVRYFKFSISVKIWAI